MIHIDSFFYWGQTDPREEIESDLTIGLLTDSRCIYYNRSYGAGILQYENYGMNLASEIAIRYAVANFVANRNAVVTDGGGGTRDRRALTSQTAVVIERNVNEDDPSQYDGLNVEVPYIAMMDTQRMGAVSLRLGGTS